MTTLDSGAASPQFLAVGHLTSDLTGQSDPAARPGGTALYAALTAHRLGLRAALFTSAADCPPLPPAIQVACVPSPATTTFVNRYWRQQREQWLHAVAAPLRREALPGAWSSCPLVLLGPVINECDLAMAAMFPRALLAATAQGWLRRWQPPLPARVYPVPWQADPALLRLLDVLVLSIEDLAGNEHIAAEYARYCPLLALTRGAEGVSLYRAGNVEHIAALPAVEQDPTGAGDVFAAALLIRLAEGVGPVAAARFAAAAAAVAVEAAGTDGIPDRAAVLARLGHRH